MSSTIAALVSCPAPCLALLRARWPSAQCDADATDEGKPYGFLWSEPDALRGALEVVVEPVKGGGWRAGVDCEVIATGRTAAEAFYAATVALLAPIGLAH